MELCREKGEDTYWWQGRDGLRRLDGVGGFLNVVLASTEHAHFLIPIFLPSDHNEWGHMQLERDD